MPPKTKKQNNNKTNVSHHQEWEFLLLSKLDWDLSAVIAPDFVEHILQRLLKLDLAWDIETTRTRVSTLVTLAYSHPSIAALPPSLIAASAILTALRPALETGGAMLGAPRDTPSPSSSSSCSSTSPITKTSHSLLDSSSTSAEPLTPLLKAMEKITGAQRTEVMLSNFESFLKKLINITALGYQRHGAVGGGDGCLVATQS